MSAACERDSPSWPANPTWSPSIVVSPSPPRPFANAPDRYLPRHALPSYRHTPGLTPHPRTSPSGHAVAQPEPSCPPLTVDNWSQHESWLWGIDLYNAAYWWEAHEHWEAAWRQADRGQATAHLLQGVIQLSAALIKWNLGNERGRSGLWQRSRGHLTAVAQPRWLGVDVDGLIKATEQLFAAHRQRPADDNWPSGPVIQLPPDTDPTR